MIAKLVQWESAPQTYTAFVVEMRRRCLSSGLHWYTSVMPNGASPKGEDWDLRRLNGSHQKHRPGTGGFAVDATLVTSALNAGWPRHRLPEGSVLGEMVQEFIKSVLVSRCSAGHTADAAQILAKTCRQIFSLTVRPPWELRREDFETILGVRDWSPKARRDIGVLARIIDENLLSLHCPVRPTIFTVETPRLLGRLEERNDGQKLPSREALEELCRIAFTERPVSHNDAVHFLIARLLVLTGLRLEEVLTLPADCLQWNEYVDVVTGRPASDVGGIGRALRLRYFAGKHVDGRPGLLVEAHQWVPCRFEGEIVRAVDEAHRLCGPLRAILRSQRDIPERHPRSDLRTMRLTDGRFHSTPENLFLTTVDVIAAHDLAALQDDSPLGTPSPLRVYVALGCTKGSGSQSMFKKYGRTDEVRHFRLQPHSLRHLMNTEFFRLLVPDTAITHQFGRRTVSQSYEYDHRSLAEQLNAMQVPEVESTWLPPGSPQAQVARMVVSGMAPDSHICRSFMAVREANGDDAAFKYLAASSDGFHVTPYGYCTNSFSASPCTRHLKCFDRCGHFMASGSEQHTQTLRKLQVKIIRMKEVVLSRAENSVGRTNQLAHASQLLDGISLALAASSRQRVFAGGLDHSQVEKDMLYETKD